ncbi:hypothetical protein VNO77_31330 [Canavalia gladiata]|uniref:Uncharacterized protein n=1 Tax=Canavalia gladiata TaxID=3824 RepID=A0AAN9KRL6_CANGL
MRWGAHCILPPSSHTGPNLDSSQSINEGIHRFEIKGRSQLKVNWTPYTTHSMSWFYFLRALSYAEIRGLLVTSYGHELQTNPNGGRVCVPFTITSCEEIQLMPSCRDAAMSQTCSRVIILPGYLSVWVLLDMQRVFSPIHSTALESTQASFFKGFYCILCGVKKEDRVHMEST